MYLSTNGLATIGGTDVLWGPLFDNANVTQASTSNYGAGFLVGSNWINGSIPTTIPGGRYYAKYWDGNPANTVVTDTYFTIVGGFSVTPASGGAGRSLTIQGSGFLANGAVNVTYNSILTPVGTVQNLTATDANGAFNLTFSAPDTLINLPPGVQPSTSLFQTIQFNVQQNSDGYLAPFKLYTEYARGLTKVGAANAGAGNVYGNNTDLTATVLAPVNSSVVITGINFYPGTVTLYWDIATVLTTTTANATGYFNTSVTIPAATVGSHTIMAKDVNAGFIVTVSVIPTFTLTPSTGPVGTSVSVTGFGLPANAKLGLFWFERASGDATYFYLTNATTGADGQFNTTVTFTVPTAYGGAHAVNAYPAVSGTSFAAPGPLPIAGATFTVTPAMSITPSNLNNTGNLVTVSLTGLAPAALYAPNIDNRMLAIDQFATDPAHLTIYPTDLQSGLNGTLTVKFIDAGFYPGVHVFSLYLGGSTTPNPFALFNVGVANDLVVGATNGTSILPILQSINSTVVNTFNVINATVVGNQVKILTNQGYIMANLTALNPVITRIDGNTATVSTSIGTITTSIGSMQSSVSSLSSTVSGLSGSISSITSGIASVQTSVGALSTPLANLDAKIVSLQNDTATIQTSLGSVTTKLSELGTSITTNGNGIATVQTTLGTIQGTMATNAGVTEVKTSLGTISGDLATLQSDVTSNKGTTESLSPLIIVAIVLALIAAIAAIASIVLMRRKIAG